MDQAHLAHSPHYSHRMALVLVASMYRMARISISYYWTSLLLVTDLPDSVK